MSKLQKCSELDKLFYQYFKKGETYDIIAQHYAETMGAALLNEQIASKACEMFRFFLSNPDSSQLDKYYQSFYNSSKKLFDTQKNYPKSVFLDKILEFQAFLGLLNLVMDNGIYFDRVINDIKAKHTDWLAVISAADQANLSIDGAKNKNSETPGVYDDCIKKYLVLKKWKDALHYLYMETIEPCSQCVTKFLQKEVDQYAVFFELIKYLLEQKYAEQITSILEITFLVRGYYFDFVRKIFGGKALGLALLNEQGLPIPETFVVGIGCKKPDFSIFANNKKYAVRSSADAEDGENHSFAGLFDSFLDINASDLTKFVQKVKQSTNSPRLQSYISHFALPSPHMAVIIQEYKECDYAGVWMGKDNLSGGLEWVRGNGEKLVSGKVTPQLENFCKTQKNTAGLSVKGITVAQIMLDAQNKIYPKTKTLADIEWCICDDELIFLQYRAVTVKTDVLTSISPKNSTKNIITGVACSPGTCSGRVKFVQNPAATADWDNHDILLVGYTSPEWIALMLKAKAIITCYGGFFSHAGIIAREFGIPCVSGIGNKITELDGKNVRVDGSTGQIQLIDHNTNIE